MPWKDDIGHICKKLSDAGYITYLSGPTSRDIKLKIPSHFYYLITTADLIAIARLFEVEFPGKKDYDAELKGKGFLIRFKYLIKPSDKSIFEILKDESSKELFTFDTLYFEPVREVYLDPEGNYYDLRERKIIPAKNFFENYRTKSYKVLDALYLSSHFGSVITEDTARIFEKSPFIFHKEHTDEIRQGLNRIMTSKNPYIAINYMDRFNILTEIFPELLPARSIEQDKDYHPEGNVYEHTLECFRYVEKPSLALAMALLLHDVGKPGAATCIKKNLRFPGHSRIGVSIARKILRRFGYKEDFIEDVSFLIRYHLLGHEFRNWNESKRKECMSNRLFPELLKLYKADILSCYGDLSEYRKISAFYHKVYKSY